MKGRECFNVDVSQEYTFAEDILGAHHTFEDDTSHFVDS